MTFEFKIEKPTPVGVTIDGAEYALPRLRAKDWSDWERDLRTLWKKQLDSLQAIDRFERNRLQAVLNDRIVTSDELRGLVLTNEGTARVVKLCAERGGVPKEMLDRLLTEGEQFDLETLALALAGMVKPKTPAAGEGEKASTKEAVQS